ncbi:MAG: hypothetical protein JO100_00005 [Pseudonocardia sp.]|nr:hypothetical protein [Pseudonocardia sp.]
MGSDSCVQPVSEFTDSVVERGHGERICRCHRSFSLPEGAYWRPMRDPEPGPQVQAVAFVGDDPAVLQMVRVPEGWHGQGVAAHHPELTAPEPWAVVGQCWASQEHPVVDVTGWPQRGRPGAETATTTATTALAAATDPDPRLTASGAAVTTRVVATAIVGAKRSEDKA